MERGVLPPRILIKSVKGVSEETIAPPIMERSESISSKRRKYLKKKMKELLQRIQDIDDKLDDAYEDYEYTGKRTIFSYINKLNIQKNFLVLESAEAIREYNSIETPMKYHAKSLVKRRRRRRRSRKRRRSKRKSKSK